MERTEAMTAATAPRHDLSRAYIDWPAVLGGAVVAAAIGGLFTAFGAALGLSTVSAEPTEGSFNLWLIVTALWVVISLAASYLAGGYIAGRMRRRVDGASADEVAARDGINGLIVWGLGMLVTAWMAAGVIGNTASAVGSVAGDVAQATGSALGGAAQAVGQAARTAVPDDNTMGEDTLDYINGTLMRPALLGVQQSSGSATPSAPSARDSELARQTGIVLGHILQTGEVSEDDRAFLIAAVAQQTGQSQAQVEARVDQAVQAVQNARAEAERIATEAEQTAIQAAETARKSAILTSFLLTAAALVAGAAAVIGGVRGGRHRDEGRLFGGFAHKG